MKVNPAMFRGYDLRGIVGTDLTEDIVEHIGRAFGTMMKRKGHREFVVARDCRESSPAFSEALIRGLVWTGADVIDIGMNLVGTFYWSQHFLQREVGVYVSASHNPPEFNGFKLANGYSETLVSDSIQELRRTMEAEDYEPGEGGTSQKRDIREAYFAQLTEKLPLDRKLKVVVDPTCSTAGGIVPDLLRQAGCEVIEFNCTVDPSFPLGTPDPIETGVMTRLSREVLDSKADIGLTFDADGDRVGVVDDAGGIIWNDVLLALYARDVLADHPGATIMYNALCSKLVPEVIAAAGGTPFMWRVGHSFLKKKNQEVGAAFIGELSGHFFFSKDYYNFDDGSYSALRILRFLSRQGRPLSAIMAELPQYVSSPEIKPYCPDDQKVEFVKRLASRLRQEFPGFEVIDDERVADGLRMESGNEMFVARYSHNGPYLTFKFEARTKDQYEALRSKLNAILQEYPEIGWDNKISVNVEAMMEPST